MPWADSADAVRTLIAAEENERQRLSRELHDQMGQHVIAFTFAIHALRPHVPSQAEGLLKDLERLVDDMDRDVHRLARDLRPWSLDLGLEAALESHISDWTNRTGIRADACIQNYEHRLSAHIETALYRLAQEALNNVVRHAHARHVSVVLNREPHRVIMVVEDDGDGFDIAATEMPPATHIVGRCGLRGMRERVALLGGTLAIESAPTGTSIFASVPLVPV